MGLLLQESRFLKKTSKIAQDLRVANNKIILQTFLSNGSLKSQLRKANKNNCNFVIIIGDTELKNEQVIWKDLSEDGDQELLTIQEITDKYINL